MKQESQENNEGKKGSSVARLREMLSVLRRHDIVHGITPQKLRLILEDMGPTYVKLGQIMSMRSDILPVSYCEELVKLRAEVSPLPFQDIAQVIEQEYGRSLQAVFASIEQEPLGSASIAQVHAAVLKNKRRVVVKVQRPGIKETMSQDIALLRRAVVILKAVGGTGDVLDFNTIIDEMWVVAQQEMDFMLESGHIKEFKELNADIQYISCPTVEHSLTTSRILVMEYVDGIAIDNVEELTRQGYDMDEIGLKLAENYCKQIFDDGFFHADPHPGNIRICGGKIVWLDLGMMGRLSSHDKALFRNAIRAVVTNDVYELKNTVLSLGTVTGRINHSRLYTDIDDMLLKYGDLDLSSINLGKLVQEFIDLAKRNNIAMPPGVTMLSRGVMTIEGVISACCPNVNFLQIISNHLATEGKDDFDIKKELLHAGRSLSSVLHKGIDIPAQLSDALKMTIKGQTKINLELTGSEEPLSQIDRMVNKLIVCLITAALLIGSSTICTTQMSPQFLGIPLLGALGFFAALILGGRLLYGIFKDRHKK